LKSQTGEKNKQREIAKVNVNTSSICSDSRISSSAINDGPKEAVDEMRREEKRREEK
jgi:hypothetical protein